MNDDLIPATNCGCTAFTEYDGVATRTICATHMNADTVSSYAGLVEQSHLSWLAEQRAKYDLPFSSLFDLGPLNDIEIEHLIWDISLKIEGIKYRKFGHKPDYCQICNDAPCHEPPSPPPSPPCTRT